MLYSALNGVGVVMRPIWLRSDVDITKDYVLLLIQSDDGAREFELREVSRMDEEVKKGRCLFITKKIPIELVLARNLYEIAEKVKLADGSCFIFDSNGDWLTLDEFEEFKKGFM